LDALVPHLYINIYIVFKYTDSHKNDIYIYIKKKKKNNIKNKHTYLSSLISKRYGHIRIPGKVDPDIRVVLYYRNLPFPPVKKCIIEGIYGPSLDPVATTMLPIYTLLGVRPHALALSPMD
jgi:hypothetical protein